MKHSINGIGFKTDKDLQQYAKDILYKGGFGPLREEDYDFMHEYFKTFHSGWEQKQGVGIKNIHKVIEPNYGKHRAFMIERVDGSTTDISYMLGNIRKKESSNKFKQALRRVVQDQIDNFRRTQFKDKDILVCPILETPITYSTCHIDHFTPTFDEIVSGFITKYKIEDGGRYLAETVDNQTYHELAETKEANDLKVLFWHYHLIVATNRMELKGKKVPAWMKLKSLWGQRTDGSFIQKSVESYCGKYISKKNAGRLVGWRHYGKSKSYEIPESCKPLFTEKEEIIENPFDYDLQEKEVVTDWIDYDGDIIALLSRLGFSFNEIVEQWHNSS